LAIKSYQSALKFNPKEPDIHNNLGVVYRVTAKYNRAIKSYKKALVLKPDFYWSWWGMGITYSDLKEYGKAIDAYRKASEYSNNDLKVMHGHSPVLA
jgi:tetratricopeptide (TPR) repeat protein